MESNNKLLEPLAYNEMLDINGGIATEVAIAAIGVAVAYYTWAWSFCYEMGKD